MMFFGSSNFLRVNCLVIKVVKKKWIFSKQGPGSIRPIFGLKISENFKIFIVVEFYSQYKDIIPLSIKICLKF